MMRLSVEATPNRPLKILCLGCHPDDIEIGCGGTILQLREHYRNCEFHWVVFSGNGDRHVEAQRGAELFAAINREKVVLKNFRDGFMPFTGGEVKSVFEDLKHQVSPDIIFTHWRNDAHQDHRLIAELTWNTFRDHFILEYEIPKYDGDFGQPNVYVALEAELCKKKVRYITDTFQSQNTKRWFEESTFLSLLRLRGMECNAPSGHAEAFYCRKVLL